MSAGAGWAEGRETTSSLLVHVLQNNGFLLFAEIIHCRNIPPRLSQLTLCI